MSFERSIKQVKIAPAASSVVAIGTYDGVHLGHQSIISQIAGAARAEALASVLLVFRESPSALIADKPFRAIYPWDVRVALINQTAIDHVVAVEFDAELRAKSAEQFFDLLKKHLNLKIFVVGHQATVGSDRADARRISEILAARGAKLVSIPPLQIDDGGYIHSSDIRLDLAAGDIARAAKMLGRRFSLTGRVVRGEQYGRKIGFPTANVEFAPNAVLPKDGVYATYLQLEGDLEGARRASATSIGVRPTVSTDGVRTVEAHILDFDQDIYDRTVRLEFVHRIRDELKLNSEQELIDWITKDTEYARANLK